VGPDTTAHPIPPSHYRVAAGRLKDAYGAAARPGSARSLTRPPRSPGMAATGKQGPPGPRTDASHGSASACAGTDPNPKRRAQTPLTRPAPSGMTCNVTARTSGPPTSTGVSLCEVSSAERT
jgi:hypothetical protein